MKDVNPAEVPENVIEVKFNQEVSNEIPTDVMFPASKNFPLTELAQSLLDEFDTLVGSHRFDDDYIFHHKQEDFNVLFSDSNKEITEKIVGQLARLKEDSRRIKYYLDELDLD